MLMDLEKDIVPKTEFDPNYQPFGHEQQKFRELVTSVFNEEAISTRLTDSQKEVLELRFLKDKSFGEISSEVGKNEEDVKKTRSRGVENLDYIFELCGFNMKNVFEEKDVLNKLRVGHKKILESFERWKEKGIFTEEEIEITKYYSKIFNGLGDKDSNTENIFQNGVSGKNKLREGDDIKKVNQIVRKTNRYFWVKFIS
jgi:predicted DNA-binding protein YlxM (UPF0122 family)